MRYLSCLLLLLSACTPLRYSQYAEVTALQGSPGRSTIDRYLLTQYQGMDTEQMRVIYLQDGGYLKDEAVGEGYHHRTEASGINIVVQCALVKCNELLIAHNHPGIPWAEPSEQDIAGAGQFNTFLKGTAIKLVASIIISDNDSAWIFLL
jgi:DNA repair protein RadC